MTETCHFNVGGRKYEVSRSLLKLHPDTMLARISSELWQKDPDSEIFIDRNGDRFQYCLDYLRDGHVALPATVPKKALLQDLQYYGVEDVKEESIDDGLERGLSLTKMMSLVDAESDKILAKERKEVEEHSKKMNEYSRKRDCLSFAIKLFGEYRKNRSFKHSFSSSDDIESFRLAANVRWNSQNLGLLNSYLKRFGLEVRTLSSKKAGQVLVTLKAAES